MIVYHTNVPNNHVIARAVGPWQSPGSRYDDWQRIGVLTRLLTLFSFLNMGNHPSLYREIATRNDSVIGTLNDNLLYCVEGNLSIHRGSLRKGGSAG